MAANIVIRLILALEITNWTILGYLISVKQLILNITNDYDHIWCCLFRVGKLGGQEVRVTGGRAGSDRRPGSNSSATTFKAKRVEVEKLRVCVTTTCSTQVGEGLSGAGQEEIGPASTSVTDPISPSRRTGVI